MTDAAEIVRLATLVEQATGPDRELDALIARIALGRTIGIRKYTASLDAAMSLVPQGLSFEIRSSGTGDRGQATVWDPMRAVGVLEWRVTGCATPALALTAAALRARAASALSDGEG